jgi:hypothetical protein
MRKTSFLITSTFLLALSVRAEERHQSYFSYEDGGTVVRQGDGRQVDARQNFPVFPGDEIRTSRRGRAEVHMADGNIIAIDGATVLRFESILDSYEGEASETVANLVYGQIIVHRLRDDSTALRLDTENASYVSSRDAIYGVNSDDRGRQVVSVYDGSIEVRTQSRTTRLRSGEQATIDSDGVYDVVELARHGVSDFERWYLNRAERYSGSSSRYLDSRLSYAGSDLDDHGSWIYAGEYGSWVWRPYVATGWRPYYHGRWVHSPYGGLVWASYEPWGWVPYHYGRWAYSPYGWVWVPGYGYSHAWVYWAWGPSYVGWVPAGWYDCFAPYYGWAYRPYRNVTWGFGFYGHIRLGGADLTPWTFVTPTGLVSDRVDRAALTTQAIRERLDRDGDRASVSRVGRFSRDEIKDPASAVRGFSRRGIGGGTGKEGSGNTADLTPFFRRDPELSPDVRARLSRPQSGGTGDANAPRGGTTADRLNRGGGSPSTPSVDTGRVTRGNRNPAVPGNEDGPRDSGRVVTRERTPPPSNPEPGSDSGRVIRRERNEPKQEAPAAPEPTVSRPRVAPRERPVAPREEESSSWRSRGETPSARVAPAPRAPRSEESWRGSTGRSRNDDSDARVASPSPRSNSSEVSPRPRSVPRSVIEGIGGPRLTPKRDSDSSKSVSRSRPSTSEGSSRRGSDKSTSSGSGKSSSSGRTSPPPSSGNGRVKRD